MESDGDKTRRGSDHDQLFAHESLSQTWKPLTTGRSANQIITVDEMREIGNITSCHMDIDEDMKVIMIKGEDESNLAQAVSRLHVLEASKVRSTMKNLILR